MFKLVVLSAFLAVTAAAPGFFHGGLVATHAAVAVPAAVSHQSRTDIISKPIVTAYAAPAIVKAAPVLTAYTAPIVAHPVVKTAPIVAAIPAVATYAAAPLAYSHAW